MLDWKKKQEWDNNPKLQKEYEDFDYCCIINEDYDPSKNEINRKEKKK